MTLKDVGNFTGLVEGDLIRLGESVCHFLAVPVGETGELNDLLWLRRAPVGAFGGAFKNPVTCRDCPW